MSAPAADGYNEAVMARSRALGTLDASIRSLRERMAAYLVEDPPHAVLIVEDHPMVAKTMRRLLVDDGYDVTVAASIAEARAMLATHPFGAVVVDQGLPDGDGWQFAEEIPRRTGVVLTSASLQLDELDALMTRTRADAAVSLLDTTDLCTKVRRVLYAATLAEVPSTH